MGISIRVRRLPLVGSRTAIVVAALVAAMLPMQGQPGVGQELSSPGAAGQLDPTYGLGGHASMHVRALERSNDHTVGAATDGYRTILAVDSRGAREGQVALVAVRPDGTLDTTFGTGGVAIHDVGGPTERATAVAVDAAGHVIVATSAFRVLRYLPDGSKDLTFGDAGGVQIDFGGQTQGATAVVTAPDLGIVVAGMVSTPVTIGSVTHTNGDVAVARILSTGELDTAASGGAVTAAIAPSPDTDSATDVTLDDSGRILVTGQTGKRLFVLRYDATLAPDPTFSGDGIVTLDGFELSAGLGVVARDGVVTVAGQAVPTGTFRHDLLAARWLEDGSPDENFGASGRVLTDLSGPDFNGEQLKDLIVYADGSVLTVGRTGTSTDWQMTFMRFGPTGQPDLSFGAAGVQTLGGPTQELATSLVHLADGRVGVGGWVQGPSGPDVLFGVIDPSTGAPDPAFSASPLVLDVAPFHGSADDADAVALMPDGGTVVAGWSSNQFDDDVWAIGRFDPLGHPATGFDGDGGVTVSFEDDAYAYDVAVDAAGNIITVGEATVGGAAVGGVTRHRPDGTLDTSFAGSGIVATRQQPDSGYEAFLSVTVDPSGGILAAGVADDAMMVIRLLPDGTLDPNFGAWGRAIMQVPGVWITDLVVLADGSLLVSGSSNGDAVLVKLYSNGVFQGVEFGPAGILVEDLGGHDAWEGVAALPDGGWIAVGGTSTYPTGQIVVRRYAADGTHVNGFGNAETGTTRLGSGSNDRAFDVAVDSAGRPVVVGRMIVTEPSWHHAAFAARLTTAGVPDPDYGTGGATPFVFGAGAYAAEVVLDGSDRALVAGAFGTASLSVARFTSAASEPDTVAPSVVITTPPDGAVYDLDDAVLADYSCDDVGGSGVVSCIGPAYGWPIDTTTPGTKAFLVTGTDAAGNSASVTHHYTVRDAVTETALPGGTVSTGTGDPTGEDPVETSLTSPDGGEVTLQEGPITETAPSNYTFVGEQVNITAPPASDSTQPMQIVFRVSSELLLAAGITSADEIEVFRNGEVLLVCTSSPGEPLDPQPACVRQRTPTAYGAEIVIDAVQASVWHLGRHLLNCEGPAAPVAVGGPTSLSVSTGPSVSDLFVDWGDGTDPVLAAPGSVSHTYTSAGVYTVTCSARHDSTPISDEFRYVVVYDPADGFVTGGGWIESPAGAYAADPLLGGRATFGFVSRYRKGASVPTGSTEFQFHAGDFRFRAEVYEWLVIAGAKARYKGVGTVNGLGGYGFQLTAVDGAVSGGGGTDRLRLKVWDRATEIVVYDNQIGADDEADPVTGLGGGSVVLHKQS